MMSPGEIESLFQRPRDELLLELGDLGHDALPRPSLKKGLAIYTSLAESLRDLICTDPRVLALRDEDSRRPELVAAIADVIATSTVGVPPFTIAVLLIRDGLPGYCSDLWPDRPDA